jgi:hypothetical protein
MLPRRIPKAPKRASRWRSQAHLAFVRSFCCAVCDGPRKTDAAHVRLGSGAGLGQKPDDWRAVPLCTGTDGCHARQHQVGEATFWNGRDVEALIAAFIKASPKRAEIERVQKERENG